MGFLNVRYKLMLKWWIFFLRARYGPRGDKKIRV